MRYTPQYLTPYKRPSDYIGPDWDGYYAFLGRSRDSQAWEESNFRCGLAAIGGESETVLVIRDSHWAVGWVETIRIHESDDTALRKADDISRRLQDYPLVDEDDYSALQYEQAAKWWAEMGLALRVAACQRAGVSVFAARREDLSAVEDHDGRLFEYLTSN